MNHEELDHKIATLETSCNLAPAGRPDWKAIWADIRQISADFKNTRYPSRENRDAAWTKFQALVAQVKVSKDKEIEVQKREAEKLGNYLVDVPSQKSYINRSQGWLRCPSI